MKKLKIGVIGVGYLGAFHAQKCAEIASAELIAVSDIDPARCQQVATQFQVPGFVDYRDLAGLVDAVSIVVPAIYHFEVARFFLSQGIHVFLEKPMATCANDARVLVALAEQHQCVLQVGFIERFNPVAIQLKKLIKTPLTIEATRCAPFSPRGTDVSVVLDLMVHDIDLLNYLFGSRLHIQQATGYRAASAHLDEVNAQLLLGHATEVYLTASRISQQKQRLMRITEADRIIQADFGEGHIEIFDTSQQSTHLLDVKPAFPEKMLFEKTDLIWNELQAFVQAIQSDQLPPISGEAGVAALTTAAQIHAAIQYATAAEPLAAFYQQVAPL